MTVWKFPVPVGDVTVSMPKGARLLTVQLQQATPCLWALCDADADTEDRHFTWVGTGHPVASDAVYVGTIQSAGGMLVFHLFEVTA